MAATFKLRLCAAAFPCLRSRGQRWLESSAAGCQTAESRAAKPPRDDLGCLAICPVATLPLAAPPPSSQPGAWSGSASAAGSAANHSDGACNSKGRGRTYALLSLSRFLQRRTDTDVASTQRRTVAVALQSGLLSRTRRLDARPR